MTIKIKVKDMEFYCEEFNYHNGCLNVDDFVGIERKNVGNGLHILLDSTMEIDHIEESFADIKKEALNNIKNNFTNLKNIFNNDIYKNEGMAVFVKGNMVVGIYPDNLENNLELLANGQMKLDWDIIRKKYLK